MSKEEQLAVVRDLEYYKWLSKARIELLITANKSILRVRELHVPKEYENTCKTCDKTDMGVTVSYPCPTIKTLDEEKT